MISLEELKECFEFRSKGRIPVLAWKRAGDPPVILRCSQPLIGLHMNKYSEGDENLLKYVIDLNSHCKKVLIIDARDKYAASANHARGAGYEGNRYLDSCDIKFMGIDNIHVMRDSLSRLFEILKKSDDTNWHSMLESTGWMKHLRLILQAGISIVQSIQSKCSVVVHCSDGWDRTAQLVALAELMLDPYYRSLRGFEILIEKEWIQFGHKFSDRLGHYPMGSKAEISPVFLQFLDTVHQLIVQFPFSFEFNEHLLVYLADEMYHCKYGSFIGNSLKERLEMRSMYQTTSIWEEINEDPTQYLNPLYTPNPHILKVSSSYKSLVFWNAYFLRWDKSISMTGSSSPSNDINAKTLFMFQLFTRNLIKLESSLFLSSSSSSSSPSPFPFSFPSSSSSHPSSSLSLFSSHPLQLPFSSIDSDDDHDEDDIDDDDDDTNDDDSDINAVVRSKEKEKKKQKGKKGQKEHLTFPLPFPFPQPSSHPSSSSSDPLRSYDNKNQSYDNDGEDDATDADDDHDEGDDSDDVDDDHDREKEREYQRRVEEKEGKLGVDAFSSSFLSSRSNLSSSSSNPYLKFNYLSSKYKKNANAEDAALFAINFLLYRSFLLSSSSPSLSLNDNNNNNNNNNDQNDVDDEFKENFINVDNNNKQAFVSSNPSSQSRKPSPFLNLHKLSSPSHINNNNNNDINSDNNNNESKEGRSMKNTFLKYSKKKKNDGMNNNNNNNNNNNAPHKTMNDIIDTFKQPPWIPDHWTTKCHSCYKKFSQIKRKV